MTEDLDELVSAYLDGALSPTERARVEADPELVSRAAQFRSVQDLVRTTPELPDALREQLITRALQSSATASNVTSLASRKRRTRLAVVGAAAAAIIAIGGIIALNGDQSDSDVASVAESGSDDAAADDTSSDAAAEATESAPAQAELLEDDDASADAADFDTGDEEAMGDEEAADTDQGGGELQLVDFVDRADLEAALVNDPASIGVVTMNRLGAFDPNAAATIFACTEVLSPDLNGAIDGVARAVITDTSAYLGVPADTEVLIVVAGDSYVVADIASCEVFATETLFS